jgi:hypothetical protein
VDVVGNLSCELGYALSYVRSRSKGGTLCILKKQLFSQIKWNPLLRASEGG